MSVIFLEHIKKFIAIDEKSFSGILTFFKVAEVRKKENLLIQGALCDFHYFVLTGCLRKFFVDKSGTEQTIDFALETWWMTDNIAYGRHQPSGFYIQAVENSTVLMIDSDSQEQLLAQCPGMERYFRFVYQRAYAASTLRIKYLHELSKEEYYDNFSEQFPEFNQRVPQYLIASFLGFTPEYLSEIKKKKLS